ncbi:conserved hypothetical protein [Vibrio phage 236O40-1]|nr:conserved hypothetical protein [Vibrio phage 236O40-1]
MELDPYEIALNLLLAMGVSFDDVYNEQGGIRREQLRILALVAPGIALRANAYKTIKRLDLSKNRKNIKFGDNIKNTMVGTVQGALMDRLIALPKSEQKKIIIKWIPSSAKEHDPVHALNYGKTMSLDVALRKELGIRYGCKCSMRVLNGAAEIEKILKDFKKGVRK